MSGGLRVEAMHVTGAITHLRWGDLHLQTPNTARLYVVFKLIISFSNFVRTARRVPVLMEGRTGCFLQVV